MSTSHLKKFFSKNQVILAPMAGVTDLVFRSICIDYGACLTYSEMISSKGLEYGDSKTYSLLKLANNEQKIAVQIFGHDPYTMSIQTKKISSILKSRLAYIDINMGCPAKKIVKKGDGAMLMKTPQLACAIVKECVNATHAPITVKFRKGFEIGDDQCIDFAIQMQNSGASAICVHGRYAMQFYKGYSDWNIIDLVAKSVDIPVIGSGDCDSYDFYKEKMANTNVSAIMIGRAAMGNPMIFQKIKDKNYLCSIKEKINVAKKHLDLFYKMNPKNLSYMRKHCMWYVKGLKGASIARKAFCKCNTIDNYREVFNKILELNIQN